MGDILFVKLLYENGFEDDEIGIILDVMDEICIYCLDSKRPCYCMCDD